MPRQLRQMRGEEGGRGEKEGEGGKERERPFHLKFLLKKAVLRYINLW